MEHQAVAIQVGIQAQPPIRRVVNIIIIICQHRLKGKTEPCALNITLCAYLGKAQLTVFATRRGGTRFKRKIVSHVRPAARNFT